MDEVKCCFQTYCGLCLLELKQGDRLFIDNQTTESDDGSENSDTDQSDKSDEGDVELPDLVNNVNSVQQAYYRPCNCLCAHPHGICTAFHDDCYRYASRHSIPLAAVTRRSSVLTPHCSTTPSTPQLIACPDPVLRGLPLELRREIEGHLSVIRSYRIESIHSSSAQPFSCSLDTSSPIWAQFTKFFGRIYVASVSNRQVDASRDKVCVLIYDPQSDSKALTHIYIAWDPWGVRRVLLTKSIQHCELGEDVWWEKLSFIRGQRLQVWTDGLKIRCFKIRQAQSLRNARYLWPLSAFDHELQIHQFKKEPCMVKMTQLIVNEPKTTGYCAGLSCDTECFQSVKRSCKLSVKTNLRARGRWLYMPLKEGDWISEVWVRHYSGLSKRNALVLVTNSGQHQVLGEFPRPGEECLYTLSRVLLLNEEPTKIFLGLHNGLQAIAWHATLLQSRPAFEFCLPRPVSAYPTFTCEPFFFSSADLVGMTEIQTCQIEKVITGVIIHYQDGRKKSLGWVSYGQLTLPRRVSSPRLWFLVEPINSFPQVINVQCEESDLESRQYFCVDQRGTLEWWFSFRQCRLSWAGKYTQAIRP